jgi:hypothetical protein
VRRRLSARFAPAASQRRLKRLPRSAGFDRRFPAIEFSKRWFLGTGNGIAASDISPSFHRKFVAVAPRASMSMSVKEDSFPIRSEQG